MDGHWALQGFHEEALEEIQAVRRACPEAETPKKLKFSLANSSPRSWCTRGFND
jgi:hypothetical protein